MPAEFWRIAFIRHQNHSANVPTNTNSFLIPAIHHENQEKKRCTLQNTPDSISYTARANIYKIGERNWFIAATARRHRRRSKFIRFHVQAGSAFHTHTVYRCLPVNNEPDNPKIQCWLMISCKRVLSTRCLIFRQRNTRYGNKNSRRSDKESNYISIFSSYTWILKCGYFIRQFDMYIYVWLKLYK